MLRDFLNEFELDMAESMVIEKGFSYDKLKNKTIMIAGLEDSFFTRAVVYAFLSLNDNLNMGLNVWLYTPFTLSLDMYEALLADRKAAQDFKVYSPELGKGALPLEYEDMCLFGENVFADYFVYTGICGERIDEKEDSFGKVLDMTKRVVSLAGNTVFDKHENVYDMRDIATGEFILFSDYRCFGKTPINFFASEYEMGSYSLKEADGYVAETVKMVEHLVSAGAKEFAFNRTILRTAAPVAVCMDWGQDFITDLLTRVAKEESIELVRSRGQYSFVYINDILQSLLYAVCEIPSGTVYHVAGKDCTVSTGELTDLIYRAFPDITEITLTKGEEPEIGTAFCADKIAHYGFHPRVTMEDIIILKIKSIINKGEIFIFDDAYQGKLSAVHDVLLAYLLEIDRICKKHNIKYFLAGGTLLGAIRHGGFIPWDDDADVMMLREDYDKFLKVIKKELPDNLFYQAPSTEGLNHCVFTKIRIDNTIFATEFTANFMKMHNGIFVDVVCHDKTSNYKLMQKLHIAATRLARSMVFNKWGKTPIKPGGQHPIMCNFLTLLKSILPMGFLEFIQNRCLVWYKHRRTNYLYDGMGRNISRGVFPKSYLDESITVDFEGYPLPVPKEYDKYLTYLYGDYRKMIPVSRRRTSHSIELMDLGEYTGFSLEKEHTDVTLESVEEVEMVKKEN
ncbi:MAG: LicD family protein [Lachnospiraceae bacterium]|nr:LicD family protein [Lachnospiraceae bacterium]